MGSQSDHVVMESTPVSRVPERQTWARARPCSNRRGTRGPEEGRKLGAGCGQELRSPASPVLSQGHAATQAHCASVTWACSPAEGTATRSQDGGFQGWENACRPPRPAGPHHRGWEPGTGNGGPDTAVLFAALAIHTVPSPGREVGAP